MPAPTLALKASPYSYTTTEDRLWTSVAAITTEPTGHSSITNGAAPAFAPLGVSYSNLLSTFTVGGGTADGFAITAPVTGNLYINTGSTSAPNYKLLNFGATITDPNVINVSDSSSAIANGSTGTVAEATTLLFLITGIYYGGAKLSGGDSKLYWQPLADASGVTSAFGVRAIDNVDNTWVGTGDVSSELNISVTITPNNDAPAGTNGTVTALEDANYAFTAANFGFTDPTDSPANALLAVKITTLPAAGTIKLSGVDVTAGQTITVGNINAGNLTFAAAAGQSGAAYTTFTFQVQDDGGTASGGIDLDPTPNTLTIDVTAVNDAPAGADATLTILEDGSHTFAASEFGFTDAADTPANTLLAVKITTLPVSGTLKLSGVDVALNDSIAVANLGNLVFTPAANANGAGYATIGFKVQDNGGTANGGVDLDPSANTLTVDVTSVNDAPAGSDAAISTPVDTAITFSAGSFGFTDAIDGNALSSVIITTLPGAGSLKLSGVDVVVDQEIAVADLGNLVFTPAAGETAAPYANFSFKVKDNGGTANGGVDTDASANTLTITVGSVDTAPSGADITKTILEDGSYTFAAADFGFSDADAPAQALLAVKITTLPASGTLKLDGVDVVAGDSVAVADFPDLVFAPAANANGAGYASFTFQVQDDGMTALGGVDLDPTPNTFTFDVTAVDDDPTVGAVTTTVAENDQLSTTTDGALSGTLVGADVDSSDTLTYSISGGVDGGATVSKVGTYGTLTVTKASGAYTYAKNAGAIEALDSGETPSDTFTVTVSDGVAPLGTNTFTVNLTGADDAPTLASVTSGQIVELDQSAAYAVESDLTGTLIGADVDIETLTYGISGGTPDGFGGETKAGTHGTLVLDTATGGYAYMADANAIEALDDGDVVTDSFTFTVTDGDGALVTQSYDVNIAGADDAPTLGAIAASVAEITQSSSTTDANLTGNLAGADVDAADTLTYGIQGGVDGGATVTMVGTYGTLTVTEATGAYSYAKNSAVIEALDATESGSDVFTVTVTDGDGALVTNTVTVSVTGADDAPTLAAVTPDGSITEDVQANTTTDLDLSGTLVGADVDVEPLTYGISGGVDGGATVSLAGDYGTLVVTKATGAYVYTKNAAAVEALDDGENDSDVFTVTVSDGDNAAVTGTYTVNIAGADDAPTLGVVTSGSVTEIDQSSSTTDLNLSGTLAGVDVDVEALTYGISGGVVGAGSVTMAGTYGTLTLNQTSGAYSYAKNAAAIEALDDTETGQDVFTVTVTDGDGALVTQTYTVDITGMDDAPTLAAATASVTEITQSSSTTDVGLTGTLAGADVDGDTLTYAITGGVDGGADQTKAGTYGTLTVTEATGAYSYAKNAAAIEALDDGESMTDVFTVTVDDGDDTPVSSTVTVTINGADDAPTLAAVTTGSVTEIDQSSSTTDLNLSGTLVGADVDIEALTYGISGGAVGAGSVTMAGTYGTLTLNQTSGAYSYAKNAAAIEAMDDTETGSDVFTVTVTDGDGPLVTQTFTVNVTGMDDAPTLAPITDGSIAEVDLSSATIDAGLSGTLVGADVDIETLTYAITGGTDLGATQTMVGTYGTLTLNETSGAYSYAKDAAAIEALDVGDAVSDTFAITVSDGDDAPVSQNYTINIDGANDAPVVTITGNTERTLSNGAHITDISIDDVDDTDAQTVTIDVFNGTLSLNGVVGLVFTTGDGTADASMTFSGSVANINTALSDLTFATSGTTDAVISITSTDDDGAIGSNYILGSIGGTDSELYTDFSTNETLSSFGADSYVYVADGIAAADVEYAVGADTTFTANGHTLTLTGYTGGINNGSTTNVEFADGSVFKSNVAGAKATLMGTNDASGDQLVAGSNGDTLRGLAGDDKLVGGSGGDTLYGGTGADMLYGKGGNDLINGGDGADLFTYTDGTNGDDGSDVIVGFQNGSDQIYLTDVSDAVLDGAWLTANVSIAASGGNTLITLSGSDKILLLGVSAATIDANDFMGYTPVV